MTWEKVHEINLSVISDYLHKFRVDGGWIYRSLITNKNPDFSDLMSMVFVPDPVKCWRCNQDMLKMCGNCDAGKINVIKEKK